MNNEKNICMKLKGDDYSIHRLFDVFVNNMMLICSCDSMKNEFLTLYKKDFDITGGPKIETFLGMVVEHSDKSIKIRFDT